MGKITHAVLMVSYNQEMYIDCALDSVFNNKVLPDLVILHDDCSTDRTWEIICSYRNRYPNILRATQNESNIGIYANINSVWSEGRNSDCDVLSWCSGDDLLAAGVFEKLNNEIEKHGIDVKNEKFIIVTNSVLLYKNDKKIVWDNYIYRDISPRLLRLGKKLSYREVGMSRNVFEDYTPLRDDIGYASDTIFTFENEGRCEKWYFADFIGAYYRVNVGVVSKEKTNLLMQSEYDAYRLIRDNKKYGLTKDEVDLIEFEMAFNNLAISINFLNWKNYLRRFRKMYAKHRFVITTRMYLFLFPPFIIKLMVYLRCMMKSRNAGYRD